MLWALRVLALLGGAAALNLTDTSSAVSLSNARLAFTVTKKSGYITSLSLDGTDLLGQPVSSTTAVMYLDGMITPKQTHYSPKGYVKTVNGTDSTGVDWAGIIVGEEAPEGATGETYEQYWILRDGETSIHAFTRLKYSNPSAPQLTPLTELRTLFRPHGTFWTHLSSADDFWVPQPKPNPAVAPQDTGVATLVQDTTWYLADRPADPYVEQVADYFTKYSLSEVYGDHTVHGMFADGSATPDNGTYGAWMVYNSKDTFFGGPTFSDLTVDGIVYNYIMSNHHGNQVCTISDGFDRTFGPSTFHFNKNGASSDVSGSLNSLRADAKTLLGKHTQFYDDIASHVPGYVPSSGRGSVSLKFKLPPATKSATVVLSAPGMDYQDNVRATDAYQYWGAVGPNGKLDLAGVKAGTYRVTAYADGVFGDFVHDSITVSAGKQTTGDLRWDAESAGTELWRIGTPDKSAGEFKHGNARSAKPLHPEEYRVYWGAYDFVDEFPQGVNFKVGQSSEANDWNYVHWATFGASMTRPGLVSTPEVHDWRISFDVKKNALKKTTKGTFTVQLAGATTAAGNTDACPAGAAWCDLPLGASVNGKDLEPWVIPHEGSGSCATRSGITCYQLAHKYTFDAALLKEGSNEIVLSLPFNATGPAVVPSSITVMYDALRLEVQ